MRRALLLVPLLLLVQGRDARAQADVAGSSDHRLFPRITGYRIAMYRDADPIIEQFRNGRGTDRDTIEGRVSSFLYDLPAGTGQQPTTQAGLVRYYEQVVQRLGGTVLHRQPAFGELHARLVQGGREYWLRVQAENVTQYNVVIAERSAPVQQATVQLAAGQAGPSCPCAAAGGGQPVVPAAAARQMLATAGARRLSAAAARFSLDTSWAITVLPARGTHHGVVTIRGLRVEDATAVRFGDYDARILARGPSEIAVVVPERPVGLTPVTVLSAAGARTARDSFQVYQDPVEDRSTDLRIYTCTEPRRSDAPVVTAFVPATVRTGDTLTIRGQRLDLPDYVSFTFYRSPGSLFAPRDDNWSGSGGLVGAMLMDTDIRFGRSRYAVVPVEQTPNMMRVVVPIGARTGPVALFANDACVATEQSLMVRVGPAPR